MELEDADVRKLRAWTGERIPAEGTEADTNFTDAEIKEAATDYDILESVAAEIWRRKAVLVAMGDLVEKSVGSEKLKYEDPTKQRDFCLDMAAMYDDMAVAIEGSGGSRLFEQLVPNVLGTAALQGVDLSRLIGFPSEEIL